MPADNPPEALSILSDAQRGFDTSLRGYDRQQVDHLLAGLDEELRLTAAERDAATARSADLAAQLASTHAQIESLRRQLRTATEQVTPANVDIRVRQALDAAHADATRLRQEAEDYQHHVRQVADEAAERIRGNARLEADQALGAAARRRAEADEAFRDRVAEADRYRAEITERIERDLAHAAEQEAQLTAEAAATRQQAEVASKAAMADAEQDFELALRHRRTQEATTSTEQLAAAREHAAQIRADADSAATGQLEEASAESNRLVREATERALVLHQDHQQTLDALTALREQLGQAISRAQAAAAQAAAAQPPAPDAG